MNNPKITQIEWGTLVGQRPRAAKCNARLIIHGIDVNVSLARITTEDGTSGFGPCRATEEQAQRLIGTHLDDAITVSKGVPDHVRVFEFPLLDLMGQRTGKPVYQLTAEAVGKTVSEPFRVPCYDTSLYIDDMHLASTKEAAALIAEEALFGYENNHRAFKIKVGRGARHMALHTGIDRDVEVVRAVREAVGPDATIMIDANNGFNLNIAKRVLAQTARCNVLWIEEAFHEDPVLYDDLRNWMSRQGFSFLIADGEGQASPSLLDWARDGLIDVVQYDIFSHGYTNWVKTGQQLDQWEKRTAPHHYGRHVGNYVSGHLAAAVDNFTFVEWDEVTTPGLDGSAYVIEEGIVTLPNAPGFGLHLEEDQFIGAVQKGGFVVQ
ncbi:MAG: enolase C-terminal domain-like protein [Chloroflexota bacterium]